MADVYAKFQVAHTFAGGWLVSGFFQPQDDIQSNGSDKWRYSAEGDLGYKLRMGNFTLTPTAGIGEVWGDTGVTKTNSSALYYAFYLAGDLKLSSNCTWNVFNARYRNAFDFTWVTPKIATGLTYNINPQNAVYGTVGYSWKDTGTGLKLGNVNVGVGYKYAF